MSKRRLRKHNSCRNLFSYKRAGNKDRKSADVRYALSESAHVVYDTLYDVVLLDFQNLSPFFTLYRPARKKSRKRARSPLFATITAYFHKAFTHKRLQERRKYVIII